MQFLGLIFCVFVIALSVYVERNFYNPLFVYFSTFLIMIITSTIRLFGLYETDQYVYLTILIGLISFFIGDIAASFFKPLYQEDEKSMEKYPINNRVLNISFVIVNVFLLYKAYLMLQALNSGYSLTEIRSNIVDIIQVSDLYSVTSQYVISPIINVLIPLGIIEFYNGKRKTIIPTIITVFLSVLSDGGRFVIFYFIIHVFMGAMVLNKKINISKKAKKTILLLIIMSFVLINVISKLRITNHSIYESIYIYIAGGLPHFSYRLEQFLEYPQYTYGMLTFAGLITPVLFILNTLGILKYPDFYTRSIDIVSNVNDFVSISDTRSFNAFVTPYYYFYMDLGMIGVIIFSLLYGFIFSFIYKLIKNKPNNLNILIYLLLIQGAVTSMVRWQFFMPSYALSFIYIYIYLEKKYIKHKLN